MTSSEPPLSADEHRRLVDRLARVLALAERPGSLGERAAAEAAIGRMIASAPNFWRQRLLAPVPAPPPPPPPPRPKRDYWPDWRDLALRCDRSGRLSQWEQGF